MKLRDPRLWLSVVSLVAVVLLVARDVRHKTSPGPLSPRHALESELNGPDGCKLCHGAESVTLERACRTCHEVIDRQMASQIGFHGTLADELQGACGKCHSEHHGAESSLLDSLAFAQAGVPDVQAFDHAHVAFDLGGAHKQLACESCHPNAQAANLTAGVVRFSDASQRCASCHDDVHEGKFRNDCASCHGQERPFAEIASFVHTKQLPLTGGHDNLSCAACHEPNSLYSLDVLAGWGEQPVPRTCLDCHEPPHSESFVMDSVALLDVLAGNACALCHDPEAGDFNVGATLTREQHGATGFPLRAPHADLACAACHQGSENDPVGFVARFPGRRAESCESCHSDAHGGQFQRGPFQGVGCVTCHSIDSFRPHTFTQELHASTAFELEPAHASLECAECHEDPVPPATIRRFAGTSSRCESCHEDAHAGRLLLDGKVGCAECHRATRFDDVDRAGFDHETRTAFALEGAHLETTCEACHLPNSQPDELGRMFGRACLAQPGASSTLERITPSCADCHRDVHAGAFSTTRVATVAAGVESVNDCSRCHRTNAFRDLRDLEFEHGKWTGFALEGAHDAIACQTCHGPAPEGSGRSFGLLDGHAEGGPMSCATCHEDPHAGRFDAAALPTHVDGKQSCARCHDSAAFRGATPRRFDHGLWTGFDLEDAHAAARCDACHTQPRIGKKLGAVPGTDCSSCHADPHAGQFADEGPTDCAKCHQSAHSFTDLVFDHARHSRFALDEQHDELECAACHKPWPLPGGGETVRYKPLGVLCTDCHGPSAPGDKP